MQRAGHSEHRADSAQNSAIKILLLQQPTPPPASRHQAAGTTPGLRGYLQLNVNCEQDFLRDIDWTARLKWPKPILFAAAECECFIVSLRDARPPV